MNYIRQGQNNNSKRSRGRGRKPQSSGNRAYDSNGPDVKIRGTATHICEKYQQLARDAITSGDRVMAENYYQHAEHYYRLIMANQVPNDGQTRPQNALGYRPDEDQEYDEDDAANDPAQPNVANQPHHQQSGGGERRNNNNNNRRRPDRNQPNQPSGDNQPSGNNAPVQDSAPVVSDEVPVEAQPQPEIVMAEGAAPAAEAAGEQPRRPVRRRRPRAAVADGAKDDSAKGATDSGAADAGKDEVPA